MKKLLLLIVSGSIALNVGAQQRSVNMVNTPMDAPIDYATVRKAKNDRFNHKDNLAHKSTAAPRWYSYTNYFDQNETALSSSVNYSLPYMWKNNDVLMTFSGPTIDTNNLVAYGIVVDPSYGATCDGFNNFDYYPGEMKITSSDSYTVDSIAFTGAYVVNPAQTSVDTLRVSFVYGNGGPTSDVYTNAAVIAAGGTLVNYGAVGSTLNNQRMHFDPARLTATGTTLYTYDILLNSATMSWAGDTDANGLYMKSVPVGVTVPAGNMIGATVAHISSMNPSWDTVFIGSPAVPPVKYNMFRAGVVHRGTSTSIAYPTYLPADKNNGVYVDKLTTTYYVPQWYWSSGSSAASVQYPDIQFRISCATCGVITTCPLNVNTVPTIVSTTKALPNPANNELNITFGLANTANVTVTLSNVLGQVVATENLGNLSAGKATFNTTTIPAGVYVYTVIADGQRSTGRVAIAH